MAKVDLEEIFAEARFRAIAICLIVGAFVMMFAVLIIYLYLQWNADIAERKRVAEQGKLAELHKTQAILQAAMDNLERSNRDLEQFAAIASHDLQEPLRMVASYTQLLAERYGSQLDDKAKKYIRYAYDGAVRMQGLINDLLAYSRVATSDFSSQPTDSQAALEAAIQNLSATIGASRAIITHGDLPTVPSDALLLTQLFQNLLSNAMKFRGNEPPRIQISAQERDGEFVFAVKDNGIGIEPQHADRVFVIFQRLHSREEYPGTGIGLAVCRRIVERHGGKIWFDSAPGTGTTFFFSLPK